VTAENPRVSVVVPTLDRPELLGEALAALERQTLPAHEFEVIVVDNGSATDATARVLARALERGVLSLRTVRNELTRGPAGGRNDGWRIARAPIVAFTDDDCEPTPGWLAEALAVASGVPGAIVQGPTLPNSADGVRQGVLSRSVTVSQLGPSYETCNIFYPRIVLERLGGFDETFGAVPAGEDTDLAWRAIESGVQTAFAPGALVLHAVHELDVRGMLREATRWSETPRVLARHPGARALLSRGVFWNGWHYCLARSAVALALPKPIRRVLLTHHALQLVARARTAGSGPWMAPVLLAYDAVEAAALVRGSIRYRTLVL
jgi:cellulose synthase/poly-beta-1,6-N-acetylglucosamine synthase-like glycosyltransferase